MQAALTSLLLADVTVAGLLSDGSALYWNGTPQGAPDTCATLYLISDVPTYVMTGPIGLTPYRVQVDLRSLDYLGGAIALLDAFKARLSGFKGTHAGVMFDGVFMVDRRDSSAKANANELFQYISVDFIIWAKPA